MTTYVIINNKNPVIGTHAGLAIVNNGLTTIYDPGGSYKANAGRGSDGTIRESGMTLQDYVNYQISDGGDVFVYSYPTTPTQEYEILSNIDNIGDPGPLFCASATSSVLSGVGPFADLEGSSTPAGLNNDLQDLGGYNSGDYSLWFAIESFSSQRMALLNKVASDLHIDLRSFDYQYGLMDDSLEDASLDEKAQYCESAYQQMEALASDLQNYMAENMSRMSAGQIERLQDLFDTCSSDSSYLMLASVGGVDPLVLDLDGDGVETVSAAEHRSEFVFADFAGKVAGWVSPDDGFLVLDQNRNGIVDDGSELFGNVSQSGFHELAQYDSNGDGAISAEDGVFANLKVWRDANSNGKTDNGELLGLSELGITGFSLSVDRRATLSGENIIFGFSEYWMEDGTRHQTGDVYLRLKENEEREADTGDVANEPPSAGENGESGTGFLSGGDADDVLSGSGEADILAGGSGCDTYRFGRGDGTDIVDNIGHSADGDRVLFRPDVAVDQLWFSRAGDDLKVAIIGGGDVVTVSLWYSSNSNHVANFEVGGSVLADADVENLVSAMAAFSPPSLGQTTLSVDQHQQLDTVIAANWKAA